MVFSNFKSGEEAEMPVSHSFNIILRAPKFINVQVAAALRISTNIEEWGLKLYFLIKISLFLHYI